MSLSSKNSTNEISIPKLAILQLGEGDENHYRRFLDYDSLQRILNEKPSAKNYEIIYVENISAEQSVIARADYFSDMNKIEEYGLEEVYSRLNSECVRPSNYYGHSLSVGDVIAYARDGISFYSFFVDDYGYRKMDDFLTEKQKSLINRHITIREELNLIQAASFEKEGILTEEAKIRKDYISNHYADIFLLADKRKSREAIQPFRENGKSVKDLSRLIEQQNVDLILKEDDYEIER